MEDDIMRFDDKSKIFSKDIKDRFTKEFRSRISDINNLTIRIHPIVQSETCRQLCITGMRINTKVDLESSRCEEWREHMNELYLNIDERNCYTIYVDQYYMFVEHRYFRSWENDTRTIVYSNVNSDNTILECNFKLVDPLLYALDKLEAMY